jgi:hypothetical protein
VRILFTAGEHRDAIRSIGSHLERLGLKTRMLLADVSNPRGTHTYALSAASDAEALKYVGASQAQYEAWAELGERLGLPLLVAELGADAGGWRGRGFERTIPWCGWPGIRSFPPAASGSPNISPT